MRGQADIDAAIDIRPFRVMIGALGQQGDPAHEPECRHEVREIEAAADPAGIICEAPLGQRGQRGGALFVREAGDAWHDTLLDLAPLLDQSPLRGQAMSGAALSIRGLACLRGGRLLFTGVDLALGPGDSAQIAGPNGIGKSSLLRIVAGLLRPFAGTVQCEGAVALTDELVALDRDRTVQDALAFWARIDEVPVTRIAAALDDLDIPHLADVPVRMLSTGQRKRAALARTLVSGAPVWLLDEPANGLDTASAAALGGLVDRHRAAGGIVLAASHLPLAWAQDVTIHLQRPADEMGNMEEDMPA